MDELELTRRAKQYMDLLAQGIDPISMQILPDDTVLNQLKLARCFFYISGVLQQVIDQGGKVGKKEKKVDFSLTPEQLARLAPARNPLRISQIADMVYQLVENPDMRRPSPTVFTTWLMDKGFLSMQSNADGNPLRGPTDAGLGIGIYTEVRRGQYGPYTAVLYSPDAQQFLIDHLAEILNL